MDDPYQARGEYETALRLDPRRSSTYLALAGLAFTDWPEVGRGYARRDERLSKATEHYEWMAALSPQEAWIYVMLGQLYTVRNDRDRALERYQTAIELIPDLPIAHLNMAQLYVYRENLAQAIEHYRIFLTLAPYDPGADTAREEIERISAYGIVVPAPGALVSDTVSVIGTAECPDFLYYKLEFGVGIDPTEWVTIGEPVTVPVKDGVLGEWHTTGLPAGDYVLRLVVVNDTLNYPPAYRVPVVILD
jgi:tetratricopeptide (TPR) repeat protein